MSGSTKMWILLGGAGTIVLLGFFFVLWEGFEEEKGEIQSVALTFLDEVRRTDGASGYPTAARDFDPGDPRSVATLSAIRENTGIDFGNMSWGGGDACLDGAHVPGGYILVMRLVEEDGSWRVLQIANDHELIAECESLAFD